MQMVAVAGGFNITLWDAYSGTFLGILGSFGQLLDIPGEINPSDGLPLEPLSGRAASSPSGVLPPLGTEFVDMIPPEDMTLSSKVNTAATVATSVASTFAKKCDPVPVFCFFCNQTSMPAMSDVGRFSLLEPREVCPTNILLVVSDSRIFLIARVRDACVTCVANS